MKKRYWWILGVFCALLILVPIIDIAAKEKNRDENVRADAVCVVSSKESRGGSRGGNIGYYVNTMDCGHVKVPNKSNYDELLEGQAYFVDLHGDDTIQIEGRNWRVYDRTCFIDDDSGDKELYDKTKGSTE